MAQSPALFAEEDSALLTPVRLPPETMGPLPFASVVGKKTRLALRLEDVLNLAMGRNITVRLESETGVRRELDYRFQVWETLPDVRAFIDEPQLQVTSHIYTGGQNWFEIRAAKQLWRAQQRFTEEARQNILRQAALAFFDLQEAYWQRGIALQGVKDAEAQVGLNEARLKAGTALNVDMYQSQRFLLARRQDLLQAENTIAKASERLVRLLALDTDTVILPASLAIPTRPLLPQTLPLAELLRIAQANNPRLQAFERLQMTARTTVKGAIANLLPEVDVTVFAGQDDDCSETPEPFNCNGVVVYTDLLKSLGAEKILGIRQARSDRRLADLNLASELQALQENLTNSRVDADIAERQIQLARDTLHYARLVYNERLERLRQSTGDTPDLEDATITLNRARGSLVSALLDYQRAQVTLLFHLGLASVETFTHGYTPFR